MQQSIPVAFLTEDIIASGPHKKIPVLLGSNCSQSAAQSNTMSWPEGRPPFESRVKNFDPSSDIGGPGGSDGDGGFYVDPETGLYIRQAIPTGVVNPGAKPGPAVDAGSDVVAADTSTTAFVGAVDYITEWISEFATHNKAGTRGA